MIPDFSESRATGSLTLSLSLMIPVARLCFPYVIAGLRHDYVCRLDLLRHGDVGMTSMPFTLPVPDTTSLLPGSLSLRVTYPTGRYSCLLPLWTLRLFVLVSS